MSTRGGLLSEEMKAAGTAVVLMVQDLLMSWEARDPAPDAGGEHPSYALGEIDGEHLAAALVIAAASISAGGYHQRRLEASGRPVDAFLFEALGLEPMRQIADALLTETVARLTGGGGPGA